MKKKEILTTKQDNLIVAVQNGVGVLGQNANLSLICKTNGLQLIDRINHEGGAFNGSRHSVPTVICATWRNIMKRQSALVRDTRIAVGTADV